ncbi:DUF6338 family protein [Azospirillum argentinense]
MPVSSADALYIAIAFIVPGYVFVWFRSLFLTRRALKPHEQMVAYIAISCTNIAICSPVVFYLLESQPLRQSLIVSGVIWFSILIILPATGGILFGVAAQKEWTHKAFQCLQLRPVHVMPTAWEWQFAQIDSPIWVTVTLKDGNLVYGLFGSASFASSEPGERDIFIESTYSIGDDGSWVPLGRGALVPHGEIRCIDFHYTDEKKSEKCDDEG